MQQAEEQLDFSILDNGILVDEPHPINDYTKSKKQRALQARGNTKSFVNKSKRKQKRKAQRRARKATA